MIVELVVSNQVANLTKRDADIAMRPMAGPPDELIGRRICAVAFAIYARRGEENGLWVGPGDSLGESVAGRWMRANVNDADVAARADTLLSQRDLAAAGLGRAVLPCYLGDSDSRLVRVGMVLADAVSELWMLTHQDLRSTARVRAFMDFMAHALDGERDLIEGRRTR